MSPSSHAERAFDALGDPTRRRVFERVRRGTSSVQEIAGGMKVSRPAVSQHLQVLKDAGLVLVRVEGTRRFYAVDPRGVEAMRKWLDAFWDHALVAFQRAAEREAAEEGEHDE
jgi:DNA-binding transcriptional ArsR family regulator